MTSILALDGVTVRFGGLVAVDNLTMQVEEGVLAALIGPNGSGKTTVLNAISGIYRPATGSIRFGSRELVGLKGHQIACSGVARTFQNNQVFRSLTVLENVMCGYHHRMKAGIASSLFGTRRARAEEEEARDAAEKSLKFVGLQDHAHQMAGSLPYGKQKLVEVARALVMSPKLLLMDEPAAGMNRNEKNALAELICEIRRSGVTVLMVEHDMKVVMRICSHLTVLNFGKKIAEGSPEAVSRDPEVVRAYLGEEGMIA